MKNFKQTVDLQRRVETMDLVAEVVCGYLELEPVALKSKLRMPVLVYARQLVSYFCRELMPKVSYRLIGEMINQNHATIIYSIQAINDFMETSEAHVKDVEAISKVLTVALIEIGVFEGERNAYYLNLNCCSSAKFENEKAAVLVGYTKEEADKILNYLSGGTPVAVQQHKNTGIFLLNEPKPVSHEA